MLTKDESQISKLKREIKREKEKIANIEQDIRDSKDAQSIQKRIKFLSKKNKEMNQEMTKYDQNIA